MDLFQGGELKGRFFKEGKTRWGLAKRGNKGEGRVLESLNQDFGKGGRIDGFEWLWLL